MDDPGYRLRDICWGFVLKYVSTDRCTLRPYLNGLLDHFQQFYVRAHLGAPRDNDRDGTAFDHLLECIGVACVIGLHDIGAQLSAGPGGMRNDFRVVLVLDGGAAGIHHGDQRDAPESTALGRTPEYSQLVAFRVAAVIYVDAHRIGAHLHAFLDRTDLHLIIGVGRQRSRSAHVYDQADIFAVSPVAVGHHAFLHYDRVG